MIIHGDCLEEMRKMEANSINAIVTDPPYGLSFMGKGWDCAVPNRTYWDECFRIMVPGSFLIAMGGTRTFHRLTCAIEDAGYEIRDCVSWIYGSGFPKSHNHFGIEGYGTALKPAWEPCTLAMKPCEGTFKQNAEKWGQAGINIDGCRIGIPEQKRCAGTRSYKAGTLAGGLNGEGELQNAPHDGKGRWPANVLFDEEAAKILDEQSEVTVSRPDHRNGSYKRDNNCYHGGWKHAPNHVNDSGGASRFFYCAKASSSERNEGLEDLKKSPMRKDDRSPHSHDIFNTEGCGRNTDNKPVANNHPTVKPLKLMEYLIKLIMPPKDGILLDPFAGSGTTILAAQRLGYTAIGIEKEKEYCEIARARLDSLFQINQ